MGKKPMIVSEKKRETLEVEPPQNLTFVYIPKQTTDEEVKKFLSKYI